MSVAFPMIGFGWVFLGVLVALLLIAAYIDYRTFTIPKPVVFAILGTGVVANLIRGIWMGAQGRGIFLFTESNAWLGILDGLLFSLVGFLVAFVLLFVLWILKTCGGGDVKLMAALGAWLGPVLVVIVWLASVVALIVIGIGSLAAALLAGESLSLPKKGASSPPPKKPRWRISYSLPVALATLVVLLWFCRVELGLTAPTPTPENKVARHGN